MTAIPNAFLAIGIMFSGELREGARLLEESLDIISRGSDHVSSTILAGLLVIGLARLGEFARAEATLERARALAKGGDPIGVLDVDIATSSLLVERRGARGKRPPRRMINPQAQGYAIVGVSDGLHGAPTVGECLARFGRLPPDAVTMKNSARLPIRLRSTPLPMRLCISSFLSLPDGTAERPARLRRTRRYTRQGPARTPREARGRRARSIRRCPNRR